MFDQQLAEVTNNLARKIQVSDKIDIYENESTSKLIKKSPRSTTTSMSVIFPHQPRQ